jgi:hypothetical protein
MIEYKGYLIFGTAVMVHPNSPDWRAVGIVYRKTSEVFMVRRTCVRPVFTSKGAAERHGLKLCREWVDETKRSNQVAEENRLNPDFGYGQ